MNYKELLYWIKEREAIYQRKEARGFMKPWTKDPILQANRFCNVYREHDTVTQWIARDWRTPHRNDRGLWFAMVVARLFNYPDTLQAIGYPVPWNKRRMATLAELKFRKHEGDQIFNGAYIVSTNGRAMDKVRYLVEYVLDPLWEARDKLEPVSGMTLEYYHGLLTEYNGLGSFMAAQVIADLKYVRPLDKADDWWTWAAPGPGSKRGLNIVYGREIDAPWQPKDFLYNLQALQVAINPRVERLGLEKLHAQDLQNCLCEYSKYYKIKNGLGRAKSSYPGA